jgi:hypothetical protein
MGDSPACARARRIVLLIILLLEHMFIHGVDYWMTSISYPTLNGKMAPLDSSLCWFNT